MTLEEQLLFLSHDTYFVVVFLSELKTHIEMEKTSYVDKTSLIIHYLNGIEIDYKDNLLAIRVHHMPLHASYSRYRHLER